jgi:hypothetical protein
MGKAAKIAGRMADRAIRESGFTGKSYGARQEWISTFMPVAEAIVMLTKAARKYDAAAGRMLHLQGRQLENLGRDLDALHGEMQGYAPFVPDEIVVKNRTDRIVQRQLKTIDDSLSHNTMTGQQQIKEFV